MTTYTPRARARETGPLLPLSAFALALALGGCSFALPSLSPADPAETTGSIARKAEPAAAAVDALDAEDRRRLRGAMAVALDPQGAGSPVNWDNPDSRHKGTITPASKPFVASGEICRDFESRLVLADRPSASTGTACRLGSGQWEIREAAKAPRPAT